MGHTPCTTKKTTTFGKWMILAIALVLAPGCATYRFDHVAARMAADDIGGALEALDKSKGPVRDHVLYLLNKATLLRMQGNYQESNAAFEEAKLLIEQLDAVSVSEQTGALSVNEGMRSYTGDDYERVLLHVFKALNYLELGQPAAARVEALQIDVKLQQLGDSPTRASEFARYFTGIVFEGLGEWDNAMIAYRNAYEAYQARQEDGESGIPEPLKYDLLRLAEARGFSDEVKKYQEAFQIGHWQSLKELRKQGEFIFFFLNNLSPVKHEQAIHAQDPKTGRMVRISTPYYLPRPVVADHSTVRTAKNMVSTAVVEDIDALAMETLDRQMPKITARAVARAMVKYNMSKKVQEQNGALGAVINIAGVVTERADTRSWATLPQNIQLARLPLAPGVYDVDIEIVDPNGAVLATQRFEKIEIKAGRKVYRSYQWVAPLADLTANRPQEAYRGSNTRLRTNTLRKDIVITIGK